MQQPIASEEQMRIARAKVQELLARVQGLPLSTDSTVSVPSVGANSSADPPAGKQPLPVIQMAEKMARTARTSGYTGSSSGNGGGRYVPPFRGSGGGNFGGSGMGNAFKKMGFFPFMVVGLLILSAIVLAGQGLNSFFTAQGLENQRKANETALESVTIELQKARIQAEIDALKNGTHNGKGSVAVLEEKKVDTFTCGSSEQRDQGFSNASVQEIASPGDYKASSGCALVRFPGSLTIKKVSGDGMVYTEDSASTTGFRGCAQGSAGRSSSSCESFISGRYGQTLKVIVPEGRSIRFTVTK